MDLQCNFGFGASGTGGGGGGAAAFIELSGSDGVLAAGAVAIIETLPFDSSVESTVLSDVNSDVEVRFNKFGFNDIEMGEENLAAGYFYIDDSLSWNSFGNATTAAGGSQIIMSSPSGRNQIEIGVSVSQTTNNGLALFSGENDAFTYSNLNDSTTRPVAIGARDFTINSGVENAVILGGDGLTADLSDRAYAEQIRFDSDISFPIMTNVSSTAEARMGGALNVWNFLNNGGESYMYMDNDSIDFFSGDASGFGTEQTFTNSGAYDLVTFDSTSAGARNSIMIDDNRSGSFSTNDRDAYGGIYNGRDATMNAASLNSVILFEDNFV